MFLKEHLFADIFSRDVYRLDGKKVSDTQYNAPVSAVAPVSSVTEITGRSHNLEVADLLSKFLKAKGFD